MQKSGITLIALVVTIIVLIILAAVSLNVLLGQNGIISKTTEAAEAMRIATVKEQIEMDILGAQIDTHGKITLLELKDKGIIDDIVDGIGVVTEDGYVFTVEEKPDGSFEVTLVGKEGEMTISAVHKINPETITSKVEITVKGTYLAQGIKEIEKPDGSFELGGTNTKILETTYDATTNGEYIFKIIGNDDKKLDYKVTITNIDTEYPSGTHELNPAEGTWGTSTVITVTGIDNLGIASIEKPDGSIVTTNSTIYTATENGDYIFKIKDTNNNITEYTVTVENIDKEGPNITYTLNPAPPSQGGIITITINATDGKSGVKNITKPNSAVVEGSTTTYDVNSNGTYTFKAKDNLDNETTIEVVVNNVVAVSESEMSIGSDGITKVNKPNLSGFTTSVTYYTYWTGTSTYTINDSTLISSTQPSAWYDYSSSVKKWANVKTTGGGNNAYWVWIPRYAYRINEANYHTETAGTIDIKFLAGTTNTPTDGSSITIANASGAGNWNVHPAFWWDKNDNGIEEVGEQLTGIWVAKFEASSSSPLENDTFGGGTNTALKVRVLPSVTSWRCIGVGNAFTVCRNMEASGNTLGKTATIDATTGLDTTTENGIDSHLMKNIEWGCVAYLSASIYGINGQVWNNPYGSDPNGNSVTKTGCASSGTMLASYYKEAGPDAYNGDTPALVSSEYHLYNTGNGPKASTTGTVYGIYDMAGGAEEHVAGYADSGAQSRAWAKAIYDANKRYKDIYIKVDTDRTNNYNANSDRYGDAIYEISKSGNNGGDYGWNRDCSYFLSGQMESLTRGGTYLYGPAAGIFAFNDTVVARWIGFRPTLVMVP